LKDPTCKKDVQKLVGKINYLRRFISNLVDKIESFLPLICVKHKSEFIWGAAQREALEKIRVYLLTPPVLRAPKVGKAFKMYITAQGQVIGCVTAGG
jgi:hypothetical protein